MSPKIPVIFVFVRSGNGQSTLGKRLPEEFPVHHISIGDLLRSIKNDPGHPHMQYVRNMLDTHELIDPQVLIPILKNELQRVESEKQGKKAILIERFPLHMAQLREFEEHVAKPALVLLIHCPDARKLPSRYDSEGRMIYDEAFTRYNQSVTENDGFIKPEYKRRGLLLEIKKGGGIEDLWKNLCEELEKDDRWRKIIHD